MVLKEYKSIFLQELSTVYDAMEIESFFYIILDCFHNKKRIDLALNPAMEIDALDLLRWESVLSDLKKQKPIQYILGETEFYGLKFLVNENTLIPRPETEELVEWILESTKLELQNTKLKLIDIGTGSGCIAISLAKNLQNSEVSAVDVSEKALVMAKKNAEINKVDVNFILKNILETNDLEVQYDVIVSNPPYVRNLEKGEIKTNVLEFEPHLALFVEDNDALLFYRKIAELALKNLSENGTLYFEINQYLGKETIELLENMGFKNIELKQDIYGNDRMIRCMR
ncbi:peptide chain release factor N(5)-glutamine methyltransferase [Flavobacterium sp. SUN052]|uniref:peptide chain release factor N(5)-glutamine methyltransferase n=1 Tax=Flavobacterium sp. SUN052 TaxID=3002441 RepID=UPI00237EE857|nr:peptide chain release factor N(5)-glutamine methyltransferase [Flavobacterium sp. SUN052]MEC4005459.1 peptide chain release factor N(5)-glutamine methyltransferase [Flavobacterium sp. SUN052]